MKIMTGNDILNFYSVGFDKTYLNEFIEVDKIFPVKISEYYFKLALAHQQIFKQAMPSIAELESNDNSHFDPLSEELYQPVKGLIHKYVGKVIILTTNNCFMNCRHCTRKRLMKSSINFNEPNYDEVVNYLKSHEEINDVLLTGGDVLFLNDDKLLSIIDRISSIKHINSIRLGTRALVTQPSRITNGLAQKLSEYKNIWINTQYNHPFELTEESLHACEKLQNKGIPICNQTVILKNVNDDYATLKELFKKLVHNRIIPYYLYLCDNVSSVTHFATAPLFGAEVVYKLRQELPGMAIPRYIIDTQSKCGKIIGELHSICKYGEDYVVIHDFETNNHINHKINFPKI